MSTYSKLKRQIVIHCDADEVCDALEISTEELLNRFADYLILRSYRFKHLLEEEDSGEEEEISY